MHSRNRPAVLLIYALLLYHVVTLLFAALHGMQTRFSDENLSVRLSVCLSNACIVTKRKKNQSIFLYHTKDHLASLFFRRIVGEGRPIIAEILCQPVSV